MEHSRHGAPPAPCSGGPLLPYPQLCLPLRALRPLLCWLRQHPREQGKQERGTSSGLGLGWRCALSSIHLATAEEPIEVPRICLQDIIQRSHINKKWFYLFGE